MRRHPAIAVFAVAVLASLAVHLPIWGVLGALAKAMDWSTQNVAANDAVEFTEFEPIELDETMMDPLDPESLDELDEAARDPSERTNERPDQRDPEDEVVPVDEEEEEEEDAVPPPAAFDPDDDMAMPVQQTSRDPTVAPPEDTNFIARENSRVEQETVADVRNMVQDAQDQLSPGAQLEENDDQATGNANDNVPRETRDEDGPEDRMPVPEMPEVEQTRAAREYQGERPQQIEDRQAREGGQEDDTETITINDGNGTFVIRRPRNQGTGGGEQGGPAQQRRRGRSGSILGGDAQRQGPNLRIGWTQFEGIYGEERLRQEREEYAAEVLTRQRGNGERERHWTEFRAAIENFVAGVRPGNQTALNARASPFAEYLAALHRRIHVSFHQFLEGLGGSSTNPMNDPELKVRLELVFAADGSIARFGVVNSSGVLPYDFGAYNAVRRAGPFPAPPDAIKSGDGLVYIHWTFERVPPFCHGQNARPYILDNGGTPARQDVGESVLQMGGVVPQGMLPTWGTAGEAGNREESGNGTTP